MVITPKQAFLQTKEQLQQHNILDAEFEALQLCEIAGIPNPRLLGQMAVAPQVQETLKQLTQRRCTHEPLQYIAGDWDFGTLTLFVGKGVLIPRADTEIVAQVAIDAARRFARPVVLDLCSGTGAIGLSVATQIPAASVQAVELSADAFVYLQKNNQKYHNCMQLVQADVFTWQQTLAPQSVQVIVSNPPYITDEEMQTLAPELSFEPRMALQAEENGLAFYRHIAAAYFDALCVGGFLVFEIGYQQAKEVTKICKEAGYHSVQVQQDFGHNDRVVIAQKS